MFPDSLDRSTFNAARLKVRAGAATAFVGAGLSVRAGFGNWNQLVETIEAATPARRLDVSRTEQQRLRRSNPAGRIDTDDLTWRVAAARKSLKNDPKYFDILHKYFSRRPKRDKAIEALARLGFSHFFTTNYDLSLEKALFSVRRKPIAVNWRDDGASSQVLTSLSRGTAPESPYLVYLHGRSERPRSIVLGEADYQDMYVRSNATTKNLYAIFLTKPAVFIGFSLRDVDVMGIFREIRVANDEAIHFALLPDTDHKKRPLGSDDRESLRNRYVTKFGIRPIFFEPGRDYKNFLACIEDLGKSPPEAGGGAATPLAPKSPGPNSPASRKWKTWASTPRGQRWTATTDFRKKRGKKDPEDPQKGRFFGSPRCNGRELSATVEADTGAPGWYNLQLMVRSIDGRPLTGKVDIWVHDSFPTEHYYTFVKNGMAKFSFSVYGAFTVGATCDGGRTPLELDLSKLRNLPKGFA